MKSKDMQSRRDFLRNAVMLAGAGITAPLWAAMKYDRNAAMRYFREQASEMDARTEAGIEANRKGDMTLLFTDAQGRPCESVHVKVRQTRHDFKYGANLFGLSETKNGAEHAAAYRERFAAAFNFATLPFYWQANEPEPGKYRFATTLEKMLAEADPDYAKNPSIKWNFTKFLIGKDGHIIRRFEPTAPLSAIEAEVEKALR